jgi:hypothetical protein
VALFLGLPGHPALERVEMSQELLVVERTEITVPKVGGLLLEPADGGREIEGCSRNSLTYSNGDPRKDAPQLKEGTLYTSKSAMSRP